MSRASVRKYSSIACGAASGTQLLLLWRESLYGGKVST